METNNLVIYAEHSPMQGIGNPGPHQIYRHPRVVLEKRSLGLLAPHAVRVRMLYGGLCGTDVHLVSKDPVSGYIRSSAPLCIPRGGRVLGHEGVGEVLATGANIQHVQAGALVTFASIIVCYHCEACRKGKFNQCRHARLLGLEEDGIFGHIVDVPVSQVYDITELAQSDRDLQALSCVEPAGVAYVACQNGQVRGGDRVVVFGAGPIGLFAAMLVQLVFGASTVWIVEPVRFRRKFAEKWCDRAYAVEEFFIDPPGQIDVVIEASGALENVTRIIRQVNANGRIVLLARSGAPLALDAIDHIITNEIVLIGSRGHLGGAFTDILALYKAGKLPLGEVVTTVLDDLAELCDLLNTSDPLFQENCKILLRLGE
jgi:D-xylulose reductase